MATSALAASARVWTRARVDGGVGRRVVVVERGRVGSVSRRGGVAIAAGGGRAGRARGRRDVGVSTRPRAVIEEDDVGFVKLVGGSGDADADAEKKAGAMALGGGESGVNVTLVLGIVALVALAVCGLTFKENIIASLSSFVDYVDSLGVMGYVLFLLGYVVLEVFAVPAFPLTMSAGALFGTYSGTLLVTTAATIAAAIAFLISRYVARDKVKKIADGYPKFKAIDKAIGEDSLRVVAVMRLSPLMPFAISNYLYGLTSVKFKSYVIGSFFGMMPGTFAYVSAGMATRQAVEGTAGFGAIASTALGIGLAVFSAGYVGKLATKAVEDQTGECLTDECDVRKSLDEGVSS